MTTRDFQFIAETISELPTTIRLRVALEFAEKLPSVNPRFDRDKFLKACKCNFNTNTGTTLGNWRNDA